jgi:hypothetical protein
VCLLLAACSCRREGGRLWPSSDGGLEKVWFRTNSGELVSVHRAVFSDGCQFSASEDAPPADVPCDERWVTASGQLEVRCTCDPARPALHFFFEERAPVPTPEELGFEVTTGADGGITRTMRFRDACFVGPLDGQLQRVDCDGGCSCDPAAKSEDTVTCSGLEPGTEYRDVLTLDGDRSTLGSVQGCTIWHSKVVLLDGGVLKPDRPALARSLVLRGQGPRRTLSKELPRDGGWAWLDVDLRCWTEVDRITSGFR